MLEHGLKPNQNKCSQQQIHSRVTNGIDEKKKTFVSIFKEEMKSQTWHNFKLGLFYCMLKKGIDQLPVHSLGVNGSLEKKSSMQPDDNQQLRIQTDPIKKKSINCNENSRESKCNQAQRLKLSYVMSLRESW